MGEGLFLAAYPRRLALPERPGTPGRICILDGPTAKEWGRWPSRWDVVVVQDREALLDSWRTFSVFVVTPRSEPPVPLADTLWQLEELGVSAPVLVAPEVHPCRGNMGPPGREVLLHGASLNLQASLSRHDPARSVREVIRRSVLNSFEQLLCEALLAPQEVPPVLRRGIAVLLRQRPPPLLEAIEGLERGREGFLRNVGAVAERVGCSDGYLRAATRACGLRLGVLVRWITVLHALTLFEPGRRLWIHVANQLGFGSPSAFTQFVARTTGESPTGLAKHPWGFLFARAVGAADRRSGEHQEDVEDARGQIRGIGAAGNADSKT